MTLASAVLLDLPSDRRSSRVHGDPASVEERTTITLPAPLWSALRDAALSASVPPSDVLLTAVAALLHRYTSSTRVSIDVEGRARTFVLPEEASFAQLLAAAEDEEAAAGSNGREGGARSGSNVAFRVVRDEPAQALPAGSDLSIEVPAAADEDTPAAILLRHRSAKFSDAAIERLGGHLVNLLTAALAEPERPLTQLALLGARERELVLYGWNDTARPFATDALLHQLFERQARRDPQATAAVCAGERIGYGELDARANRLAHHLQALGVGPGVFVAICLQRSLDMLVAVLGVLKAGGAYVPIDPDHPAERQAFMVQDAGARVAVSSAELAARLPEGALEVVRVETLVELEYPTSPPVCAAGVDDLAYAIYTSGSTGRPKAVAVRHRSVLNLIAWVNERFDVGPGDRLLFVASLSFDLSVYDLFGILAAGGSVHVATRAELRSPQALVQLLASGAITFWDSAPATLAQLAPLFPSPAADGAARGLRLVFLSGDWIPVALPDQVRAAFPGAEVIALGGATEATVWSNYFPVGDVDPGWTSIPYGRPIQNSRYYVLDAQLQPQPIGVPGDLYIGGACVADGYLARPELTAEKFLEDPFVEGGATRLYRTGDRARFLDDGNLEFLGRLDDQVKIRGFRIELGEVESVLGRCEGVQQAVVVQRRDRAGDKCLVGYVVLGEGRDSVEEVAGELRRRLPEYMIPAQLVRLDRVPLTANGKVDRRRLPEPSFASEAPYAAPRTETERALVALWQELLGSARVGVDDDFFRLGGNSLLAAHVVAHVRDRLGSELSLSALFERPTIAGLARYLETARHEVCAPRRRAGGAQRVPMSSTQERLWFLYESGVAPALYNVTFALEIEGGVDPAALDAALSRLVARHEILRTTFDSDREGSVQVIQEHMPFELELADVAADSEDGTRRALEQATERAAALPFDLRAGPNLRALLLRVDDRRARLVLTQHHMLTDERSMQVLFEELAALYVECRGGEPASLAPLEVQFADFSQWALEQSSSARQRAGEEFFRTYLQGAVGQLDLPADRARPRAQSHAGRVARFRLDRETVDRVGAVTRANGVTPFMTLLSALEVLLWRMTRSEDLLVGTPVSGRGFRQVERTLGFFANTVLLRADLSGSPTFRELLSRTRRSVAAVLEHQEVPFDRVVRACSLGTQASGAAMPQVMLVLRDRGSASFDVGDAVWRTREVHTETAKFDLTFLVVPEEGGEGGADVILEYNVDVFDAETAATYFESFRTVLEDALARPDARIGDLQVVSEGQRGRQLEEWSGRRVDFPAGVGVHALFSRAAAASPERVALRWSGGSMSYAELERRSDVLARYLLRAGVGLGDRVALFLPRSELFVVALLGALKAGAAYVPVDPEYPRGRALEMLRETAAACVLTTAAVRARLPEVRPVELVLDDPASIDWTRAGDEPLPAVSGGDLAYVMYTSGSTGASKGVLVPHRAISRLVSGSEIVEVRPDTVFLLLAPTSFDASTFEIWAPLANGACLAISPPGAVSLDTLRSVILEHGVTTLWLSAGLFQAVVDEQLEVLRPLRHLLAGGDVLSPAHVAQVRRAFPHLRVTNGYGPTENTTFSCCHDVAGIPERAIPIGAPIPNTSAFVLDAEGRLLPDGTPGELYVGGDGLADGYLDDPDLTARKFVPSPLPGVGGRLYRTGDLVRFRSDGLLEFLGRLDRQVKLRGVRVELAGVEALATRHPDVRECAVVLDERGTEASLALYFVGSADASALREHLEQHLAQYMRPNRIVQVAAMPLDPNGKVDRNRLLELGDAAVVEDGQLQEPEDSVEAALVDIWESLLGVSPISTTDDFFDLGGHSLLALRLCARLESQLGFQLPLTVLLDTPTIRQLAAHIRGEGEHLEPRALAPLRAGGPRPPLFFLPGVGGHPFKFRLLARHLDGDRPYYGVQLVGIDGRERPLNRIEEMAERYLAEISEVQPDGPVCLAGYSAGGLIAAEMAVQLRAAGREVGCLILMDAFAPGYPTRLPWARRVAIHARNLWSGGLRGGGRYLAERVRNRGARAGRWLGLQRDTAHRDAPPTASVTPVDRELRKALASYRGKPYDGPLLLILAETIPDWPATDFDDPYAGWRNFVQGPITLRSVPGSHLEIFDRGSIEVLATHVREYLSQVPSAAREPS